MAPDWNKIPSVLQDLSLLHSYKEIFILQGTRMIFLVFHLFS